MAETTPTDPVGAAARLTAALPRFRITVPDAVRLLPTDPKVVTVRQLTVGEEKMVADINGTRYDAIKHMVVAVDGRPLTWDNGEKERFIEGCSAKVRDLLVQTYDKIHKPTEDEAKSFFGSMEVEV